MSKEFHSTHVFLVFKHRVSCGCCVVWLSGSSENNTCLNSHVNGCELVSFGCVRVILLVIVLKFVIVLSETFLYVFIVVCLCVFVLVSEFVCVRVFFCACACVIAGFCVFVCVCVDLSSWRECLLCPSVSV